MHLPGQSLTSSKKGWSITAISRREVAPPAANKKPGGGPEPLTSDGDGCSWMCTGGRAQHGRIGYRGSSS
jgi:hypothetical protein